MAGEFGTTCPTQLTPDALRGFLAGVAAGAGVAPVLNAAPAPGVEVVRRRGADHSYLFVLNHTPAPVTVTGPGHDLVGDRPCGSGLTVPGHGWAVVRLTLREGWSWGTPAEG